MRSLVTILPLCLLSCASLESVTAREIGCQQTDVAISDVEQEAEQRTWVAECNGKRYKCSSRAAAGTAPQATCKEDLGDPSQDAGEDHGRGPSDIASNSDPSKDDADEDDSADEDEDVFNYNDDIGIAEDGPRKKKRHRRSKQHRQNDRADDTEETPSAARGCQYDSQCKGDRLCIDRECTAPPADEQSSKD